MSFQFPEKSIPPSTAPSGTSYPALLIMREAADIPTGLSMADRDVMARRITRRVMKAFWYDVQQCSAAPFLQLMGRGGYNQRAKLNRDRIARDLAAERAERMALQAA